MTANHPAISQSKLRTVVIDAGHGGFDPGNLGSFSKEKDVALKIALKVGEYINKYIKGVKVIYTRKDDRFIDLKERAEIANKNNADLFISIHCNSVEGPAAKRAYGTETWVMGLHAQNRNFPEVAKKENAAILLEDNYKDNYEGFDPESPESHIIFSLFQNAYRENSTLFAKKIEDQFKFRVGRKSRGVKEAGFVVLWKAGMPSVLIETGFLTYPPEERYLNSEEGQVYIASGIFRAFRDYKNEIEALN
ncbi:N-acetylmuramoyl-L-alanine amidase family protein [Xanthovirga aplysinae]|uniref:N-acetylmuramoyl-L-alanine amidase family protein n=1 Tax=Xanthovirga aplysinae TaxID=2529853 RepID=UPI0012BB5B2B|nr:N-acetylmuramoyl-L-alanine amidase [Xanthovirga aplysinae]